MSLITQCPACSTMFKVVPDQLRISDGWVRCGQCDEVFDANANLHSESVPVSAEFESEPEPLSHEPVATTSPDPDWAASLQFATDEPPQPVGRVIAEVPNSQGVSAHSPQLAKDGEEHRQDDAEKAEQSKPGLDDFLSQSPKALAQAPQVQGETPPLDTSLDHPMEVPHGSAPRYTQYPVAVADKDAAKQPSFMRKGHGASIWHKTGVRVALGFTGLMLVGVLAVQVAIQERDRWAAYKPSMAPALEALCEVMGCTLSPLRNIESVVIDSSSFTKVRTDVYRLNVALKNNGPVPLAPPALELTLTDMQDQSLIRRVLKPQDIGFKSNVLEPGAEFAAVLPIAVKAGNSSERVSGYRLLVFYP